MAKRTAKRLPMTVRVSDLVLNLKPAEEGGFVVTSPFDPALITEAESIEEAIDNALDADAALKQARAKRAKRDRKCVPNRAIYR